MNMTRNIPNKLIKDALGAISDMINNIEAVHTTFKIDKGSLGLSDGFNDELPRQ
jgi:hypothetical protein